MADDDDTFRLRPLELNGRMLAFLRYRWFLIALVAVLVGGMFWWRAFQPLTERIPRNAVVAAVMLLMALPMETAAMWQAIRRPAAAGLVTISIRTRISA